MKKMVVITGASSGLGRCIKEALLRQPDFLVSNWSLDTGVDVRQEGSVSMAAHELRDELDGMNENVEDGNDLTVLYALINCAGVNAIEFIPLIESTEWDRVMDTNAKGIFLTTKHLVEDLRGGTILNIVSNASHVPMTSSLAYNASKGAAAIMTKQMSRELIKTHDITVFGISPNKLRDTGMSAVIDQRVQALRGWTAEQARNYQLAALPAGEETDPEILAEFIAFLLSKKERHKYLAGCDLPYGL